MPHQKRLLFGAAASWKCPPLGVRLLNRVEVLDDIREILIREGGVAALCRHGDSRCVVVEPIGCSSMPGAARAVRSECA
jgi:hypothetical protein